MNLPLSLSSFSCATEEKKVTRRREARSKDEPRKRGEFWGKCFQILFNFSLFDFDFFFCYKINFPQEESVSPVTVTGDLSLSSSQSEPFFFLSPAQMRKAVRKQLWWVATARNNSPQLCRIWTRMSTAYRLSCL